MVRSFTVGGFTTDSREDYVVYVHIDVNLDGRGVGLLLLDLQ